MSKFSKVLFSRGDFEKSFCFQKVAYILVLVGSVVAFQIGKPGETVATEAAKHLLVHIVTSLVIITESGWAKRVMGRGKQQALR